MGLLGAVRGCDLFLKIPGFSGKPARCNIGADYTIEPLMINKHDSQRSWERSWLPGSMYQPKGGSSRVGLKTGDRGFRASPSGRQGNEQLSHHR
jgi:hypothetical protein